MIVRFNSGVNEKKHKKAKDHGSTLKTELPLINSAVHTMRASDVAALARDPQVEYISIDRPVMGKLDHAAPTLGADLAYNSTWDGVQSVSL